MRAGVRNGDRLHGRRPHRRVRPAPGPRVQPDGRDHVPWPGTHRPRGRSDGPRLRADRRRFPRGPGLRSAGRGGSPWRHRRRRPPRPRPPRPRWHRPRRRRLPHRSPTEAERPSPAAGSDAADPGAAARVGATAPHRCLRLQPPRQPGHRPIRGPRHHPLQRRPIHRPPTPCHPPPRSRTRRHPAPPDGPGPLLAAPTPGRPGRRGRRSRGSRPPGARSRAVPVRPRHSSGGGGRVDRLVHPDRPRRRRTGRPTNRPRSATLGPSSGR